MDERTGFLTRLKARFGDCSLRVFLEKMRNRFKAEVPDVHVEREAFDSAPASEPMPEIKPDAYRWQVIDINGTDAWRSYMARLKDILCLYDCLDRFKVLPESDSMVKYANSVQRQLADIPSYLERKFKEPEDIDEDTSEKFARQIGTFAQDCISELLRGCHKGAKYSEGETKQFYEIFAEHLEKYLSSVGIYRKDIMLDKPFTTYAKWFKASFSIETDEADRRGFIAEIEFFPHTISYRNEFGETEELILKGSCIVFS